ncbi:MAG: PepSY-associated TM helix domain-containing protein [Pseudomonadota bacterium]
MSDTTASPAIVEKKPSKKKSSRKQLYALHSWLGFHLALVMAVVLFTGTIATVTHEIDWVFQSDMRVNPDGEKVSWETMVDAIQDYAPRNTITTIMEMEGDHFAYRAFVLDEYGRRTFIHVNQWTGEVTGETHPLTVQRVFRDLHRYLFMPNYLGLPIVTSLAFILAISLYTGLKTTRNWRTLLFRVRTDKGTRIMWGDAHKAAGLWGIWFFVVIIVTGVWYLVEFGVAIGLRATDTQLDNARPRLAVERVAEFGPVIQDRPLDEVVAAAVEAFPELTVSTIQFPTRPNAPIAVQGKVGNPIIRERSNTVYLDPVSLEVLKVQRWRASSTFVKLNEMADPLHFGTFGGLPTKLIWFVFGVAMTGLSVTGVWLTWKRLKSTAVSKAQFATMPVLFISMVFCTKWYDRLQGPDVPHQERLIVQLENAAQTAELWSALDAAGKPTGSIRILINDPTGRPSVESITINDQENHRVRLQGNVVAASFDSETLCSHSDQLAEELGIHFTDGSTATYSLSETNLCHALDGRFGA